MTAIQELGVIYPTDSDPYYDLPHPETGERVRLIRNTACLALFPRWGLDAWHGKMASVRAVELLDKWETGIIDEATFRELFTVERLMRAGLDYRDFKGDSGSVMHRALYDWGLGTRVDAKDRPDYTTALIEQESRYDEKFLAGPEDCLPHVNSILDFCEITQPEVNAVGAESICANYTEMYAGRVDVFGTFHADRQDKDNPLGREVLYAIRKSGDGKTLRFIADAKGSDNKWDWWRCQLAGYGFSEWIVLTNGTFHPIPKWDAAFNFWTQKDGPARLVPQPCGERELETLLAARDLHELINNPSAKPRLSRAKTKESRFDVRPAPF